MGNRHGVVFTAREFESECTVLSVFSILYQLFSLPKLILPTFHVHVHVFVSVLVVLRLPLLHISQLLNILRHQSVVSARGRR